MEAELFLHLSIFLSAPLVVLSHPPHPILSAWCERITHCSKENTSGTSSNICLHFSDLPLSALGLSLFLHGCLSSPPTPSLSVSLPAMGIIEYSISYLSKIIQNHSFSIQLNLKMFFMVKQVEKHDFFQESLLLMCIWDFRENYFAFQCSAWM